MMGLVVYPDDRLTKPSVNILGGFGLADKVSEMIQVMLDHRGAGIAAPQIGWNRNVIVVSETGRLNDMKVFLNPKLSDGEGEEVGVEGCLSLPGEFYLVPRFTAVSLEYHGLDGQFHKERLKGNIARVVQHEVDHLHGLLINRFEPAPKDTDLKASA